MPTMRAWRLHPAGQGLEPRLETVPRPEAGPGQLLLRVRAAGLNRGELMVGHGPQAAGAKPAGTEAAGEVVAVGAGVEGFAVGDRVMARCPGGFAEYAKVEAYEAIAVPPALDWAQAGSIPLTNLVVHDMLVAQGRLQAGETLLVAGVTSGVGVNALLAAKAMGAKVIGTSGSAEKLERLKREGGLDVGLHVRPEMQGAGSIAAIVGAVREATGGRGANLAIDGVGGSVFPALVESLAYEGRLAMVGYVDGQLSTTLDLERLHLQRLTVFGVSNKLRTPAQRTEAVCAFRADWLPLYASGRLRSWVDRVFPFEQLAEAKDCMEAGGHLGKIVLAGAADA